MAVYGTFIVADGVTEVSYKHNADTCECSECDDARWMKAEKAEEARHNEYTVLPTNGEWLTYAEAHYVEGEEEDEETGYVSSVDKWLADNADPNYQGGDLYNNTEPEIQEPAEDNWETFSEESDEDTGLEVCSVCHAPVECRCVNSEPYQESEDIMQEQKTGRMGRPVVRKEGYRRTTIDLPQSLIDFLKTKPNRTKWLIEAAQEKRQREEGAK